MDRRSFMKCLPAVAVPTSLAPREESLDNLIQWARNNDVHIFNFRIAPHWYIRSLPTQNDAKGDDLKTLLLRMKRTLEGK
jgi:hypothetical protein